MTEITVDFKLTDKTSSGQAVKPVPNPKANRTRRGGKRKRTTEGSTTAVVGASQDYTMGDDSGWMLVTGKGATKSSVRAILDSKNIARRAYRYHEQRLRLRNHFPFIKYTFNNVSVPFKMGDIEGERKFGTVTYNNCPFYKSSKTNPVPCWLRKPVNGVNDFCKIEWTIVKTKHGEKPTPKFALCKNHRESESIPTKAACELAMKEAMQEVEKLQQALDKKRSDLLKVRERKKRDGLDQGLKEWEVDELCQAVTMFFETGLFTFKEFQELPYESPNVTLTEEGWLKYEIFTFSHDTDVRNWYIILNACVLVMNTVSKVKAYFPYPVLKNTFNNVKPGSDIAMDFALELCDGSLLDPAFTWTYSPESYAEYGSGIVVDKRIHLHTERSVNTYVARPLANWGDVVIDDASTARYFYSACLDKVERFKHAPPYCIWADASNKKFKLKVEPEDREVFNAINKSYIEWRAGHPTLYYPYLSMMADIVYVDRHGALRFKENAFDYIRYPRAGGGKDSKHNPKKEEKPTQGQAAVVNEKSGGNASKPEQNKQAKPTETKVAQQDKKRQKKVYRPVVFQTNPPAAPDPVKETSATQPAVKVRTPSRTFLIGDKEYSIKMLGPNWTYTIAGTGWCSLDTAIHFLECTYPTMFNGVPLTIKREFVALYARLSSDWCCSPCFTDKLLAKESWMVDEDLCKTLSALGFNVTIYKPEGVGEYNDLKFRPILYSPAYKDAKIVPCAHVYFNGYHFEPLNMDVARTHILDSSQATQTLDSYLFLKGDGLANSTLWQVSDRVKLILAEFLSKSVDVKHSFKYVAMRQLAVANSWHIGNDSMKIYPYESIEDDETRRLMTGSLYNKEQDLIFMKMRSSTGCSALLQSPDFFVKPELDDDDKPLIERIEKEEVYKFVAIKGIKTCQPLHEVVDHEKQWKDIITSLIKSKEQVGPSALNLEKTPETKDESATYYLTPEEYEAKKRKLIEKNAKKLKEMEAEWAQNIDKFKQEYDERTLAEIKAKDEEIEKLTDDQKKANEEAIKKHQDNSKQLAELRGIINDLQIQIEAEKRVSMRLAAENKQQKTLIQKIWEFILALLGFPETRGGGGYPSFNTFRNRVQAIMDKIEEYKRIQPTVPEVVTPISTYERLRRAIPNPKQIVNAGAGIAKNPISTVNKTMDLIKESTPTVLAKTTEITKKATSATVSVSKQAAVKAFDLIETGTQKFADYVDSPDNIVRLEVKATGLDFKWLGDTKLGGLNWAFALTGKIGFVKIPQRYGFRSTRNVALEYNVEDKSLTTVNEYHEVLSLGKFGIACGGRYNSTIGKNEPNLEQGVENMKMYDSTFVNRPIGVAEWYNNLSKMNRNKKDSGGGSMSLKAGITSIGLLFTNFIVDNSWKRLSIPVGATVKKIPSSIQKPFMWNDSPQSVSDITSSSLTVMDFHGKEVLADYWVEVSSPQNVVRLNSMASSTAVPPRLGAMAKTLVAPDFRIVEHNYWVKSNLKPSMALIRSIVATLRLFYNIPQVFYIAASTLLPMRFGSLLFPLLNAVAGFSDNLLFTIDYRIVTLRHLVAMGAINQMNIKGPTVSDPNSKAYIEQRAAVQAATSMWFNNLLTTSPMMGVAALTCQAEKCAANWMASTGLYAVVHFDHAAPSSLGMVRRS